jgi:fructose-specific component phosphotransferase system IIB-like protein
MAHRSTHHHVPVDVSTAIVFGIITHHSSVTNYSKVIMVLMETIEHHPNAFTTETIGTSFSQISWFSKSCLYDYC